MDNNFKTDLHINGVYIGRKQSRATIIFRDLREVQNNDKSHIDIPILGTPGQGKGVSLKSMDVKDSINDDI